MNGFPKWTPEVTWSSPACADIDNDGYFEIVVGTGHYYQATGRLSTEGFRVYAYNSDGSMCAGFPVVTAGSTMSSPAIGDVDGDGIKEIAIACNKVLYGEDHLMLIKGNGAVMWDQLAFGGPNMASPVLGDIDSDGQPEVILGSGQAIGAWKVNGACVWNQVLDSFVVTSPCVGDFDNDGRVETAVGTGGDGGTGSFWVFDCGTKRKVNGGDAALFPWPMFHHDPAHNGSILTGNEPPPPPPPANFHEYILMMNPGTRKANVTIEFMNEKGEKTTVKWTVEPLSRSTLHVNSVLPGAGISAKVSSDVPIIAERPMYFNYKSAWDGGHNVMGALCAQKTWYFAEGTCRPNFDPYLCIQNPGGSAAAVRITYMKGDGATQAQDVNVPAHSRSTVRVKDALGEGDTAAFDFSCKVESTNDHDVIVERPMYFNYAGAWTGGHNVMGAGNPAPVWYFAEGTCRPGFESYLCVQNPGSSAAAVKVTYMLGDGTTKDQTLSVPKNSRQTVRVKDVLGEGNTPAFDFSCKVETTNDHDVIVERPMYFNYAGAWTGGHDVMGALAPGADFYFAEGTCRPNFEPYLCLQNPGGTAAAVKITYMKGDGGNQEQTLSIPARSRRTVRVKEVLGEGNSPAFDFSCKVETTNNTAIIAERPMYFNYNGWTGGHDVVGVPGPANDWYFAEGYTGN
ncbi:MAG: VCBS repeat-containing protein [Actinomycetota bacterium]